MTAHLPADDVEVELVHVVRLLLSVLRFLVMPVALILIFFVCRLEADVLVLEDLTQSSVLGCEKLKKEIPSKSKQLIRSPNYALNKI